MRMRNLRTHQQQPRHQERANIAKQFAAKDALSSDPQLSTSLEPQQTYVEHWRDWDSTDTHGSMGWSAAADSLMIPLDSPSDSHN